ncbi:hypothetical protein Tco_1558253 [Tanacetum coccineum]
MMVQPTQDEGVDSGIPDTAVTQEETQQDDSVPTPSNDLPLSGEDSMQLSELMLLCTNLQKHVLDLEKAKDAQAKEIANLKKRESLADHEDASKQGRSIEDIDKDVDALIQIKATKPKVVTTAAITTTTTRPKARGVVVQDPSVKEREVDTSVEGSAAPTTIEEITLA